MPLVENGRIVEDIFRLVADDEVIPADGAILVSAARLLAEPGILLRPSPTGVTWPNARDVVDLAPHLDRLALVALEFPKFRDGRAYSQARLLRERHGFRGAIRATGDVLRDQFVMLVRSGFDSFEVKKYADASAFADTLARQRVVYQPAVDGRPTAFARRLASESQRS
jgi:uncharacterized protein (DUF934 family)